jgi:hypothetical protein
MDETKFKKTGDFTVAKGHGHPLVCLNFQQQSPLKNQYLFTPLALKIVK